MLDEILRQVLGSPTEREKSRMRHEREREREREKERERERREKEKLQMIIKREKAWNEMRSSAYKH